MTQSVIDSPINDHSKKRRAVYTALFPYFSSEILFKSMWLWEDNYSSGHGPTMRQFVAEITQGVRDVTHTKKIYNALMNNFQKPVETLESDPIEMMNAYRAGKINFDEEQSQNVVMNIPENIVFNFLLENIHLLISKDSPYLARKANEYLSSNIFNLGLTIYQTKEIKQWTENHDLFIGMKYSTEQLSKLLHVFYIGICEFFGPQKADFFLNTAIKMAENIPEAKQFPAKNFL